MSGDHPIREPDQIRRDCARKLGAVEVSDHFQAILGCLLGENWTTPRLVEMVVTPDGHLLGRCDDEASFRAFLGASEDLVRNIHGVAPVTPHGMSKQVVLLRVGVDAGCGGIQGPLFGDGSFEFVCIPDNHGVSAHTYGNMLGRDGKPLSGYFAESRRAVMAEQHVHHDPEFETFTYGDPTTPKRSLRYLRPGDILAFYCGLQAWDAEGGWNTDYRPALYLAGYFEVALAGMAAEFDPKVLRAEFGNNFHVRYPSVFKRQKADLVLVKGGPGSRLFRRAHRISSEGKDRAGKPLKVLSPAMRKVFGDFGGHVSIQRSPPRWVEPRFVDKATGFLKGLE